MALALSSEASASYMAESLTTPLIAGFSAFSPLLVRGFSALGSALDSALVVVVALGLDLGG